jgi:hypothetical protein
MVLHRVKLAQRLNSVMKVGRYCGCFKVALQVARGLGLKRRLPASSDESSAGGADGQRFAQQGSIVPVMALSGH